VQVIEAVQLNGKMNALTIDVEDWFQVANLREAIRYEDWEKCESRVERNVGRILRLLSIMNVKATFFILGWIAEKKPDLVKLIHNLGHELAIHGYSHRSVSEMTPDEFREEIRKTKDILERLTGAKVLGFRAPNYSILPNTIWACQILAQLGMKYDSSIFPVKHDRYGFLGAPRFPFVLDLKEHGRLIEFPMSTIRLCGSNIPVAGGAYLRLYPYWFIKGAIKSLNKSAKPAILYLHPWEIDVHQPRMKLKLKTKIRHYGNLRMTERKLFKLLTEFEFGSVKEVLGL
jgi:polysaccharide deacetylase family protein (PEP-CTERM system associated)